MKILVTGCAGFIGSNLVDRLLADGCDVVGVDNFNDYYDPKIKEENVEQALTNADFKLYREDILNYDSLKKIFEKEKINKIIHLAARAGVRPSIENPGLYAQVNVLGAVNILKLSVDFKIEQFIFGSSSSVYGNSEQLPFKENDPCDKIISPYGASKRAAEFWVETFWRTYGLKSTILRFFTVYGPRGRRDMAPAIFTNAISAVKEVNMFGDGSSNRDYTYVDDIVDGIVKTLGKDFDFEIINLGNSQSVSLADLIKTIEKISGEKAKIKKMSFPLGDANFTLAQISKAKKMINWMPHTSIEDGIKRYWDWLSD